MIRISTSQILFIHEDTLNRGGGLRGIRDISSLESGINSVFQTFDGYSSYPSIEEKAARLGFCIIKNHPFTDGNKRTGLLSMITFLEMNGIEITAKNKDLVEIGFYISLKAKDEKPLLKWIYKHSKK